VTVIAWNLDLQLPVQSVRITTDVVSSNLDQGEVYTTNVVIVNPAHGEVYSIKHYVIKFDLRQVTGFLRVLWFPPSIKLKVALNTINQPTNPSSKNYILPLFHNILLYM